MIKLTSCKLVTGLLLLLAAIVVHAQMGLDIDLNRTVYMQYEPVYACISLRNDSGRALVFGNDPRLQGFILFEIRDANGRLVPKRPGAERVRRKKSGTMPIGSCESCSFKTKISFIFIGFNITRSDPIIR